MLYKFPDDTDYGGPAVWLFSRSFGTNTAQIGGQVICDPSSDLQAKVLDTAPAGTEAGLVTRNIPSGTQAISHAVLTEFMSQIAGENGIHVVASGGSQQIVEGTDITGAAMPTGGAGLRGWLSAIWKKLGDLIGLFPAALSAGGNLKVSLQESNASQAVTGTLSISALPGTTLAGQTAVTFDYDTGVGVQSLAMLGFALPKGGGAVPGGTSADPLRIDPTGATTQPVSGTISANINNPGTLALDATLTGGSVKSIARGGAKGTTGAADVTSTAEGANNQALDVQLWHGAVAVNPTQMRALTAADVVTAVAKKDTGRVPRVLYATATAGVTTEALLSLLSSTGYATNAAATAFTVTAGKVFRVTGGIASIRQTAAALNWVDFFLRVNPGGAVATNSAVALFGRLVNPSNTSAAGIGCMEPIAVPDGLEIPAGAGFGVTHRAAAVSVELSFCLFGFEYTP